MSRREPQHFFKGELENILSFFHCRISIVFANTVGFPWVQKTHFFFFWKISDQELFESLTASLNYFSYTSLPSADQAIFSLTSRLLCRETTFRPGHSSFCTHLIKDVT